MHQQQIKTDLFHNKSKQTDSLKLGLVDQFVKHSYLQISIKEYQCYSRTFIKFTAIEFKLTVTAKTTCRITQIENFCLFIDATNLTTNKEAIQNHFLLRLKYTIIG